MEYIKKLNGRYRKNDPLMVTHGKVYEYLKMILDFRQKSSCIFSQFDAIKKFWLSLPEELKGPYHVILALQDLFKVDMNREKLDTKKKKKYYRVAVKCLYSQRLYSNL